MHIWSQAIPDLQPHPDVLTKFIYLIEKIDGLSDMERRFHREGLSFYHAISKNRAIAELKEILTVFFEESPISTVVEPDGDTQQGVSVEHMGGIQGEQVMFVKKIGEAEFYGALWPWKDKKDVVTIHLGVCAPSLADENHQFMYSAMKGHLTESTSEKIDVSVRGLIQGISLSSFLQMSEMEGSTCTLEIKAGNKTGTLHLLNGNVIDAETGSLKYKAAAFTILGWENAEIYIQKPSGRKKNEINLPLMHLLIEALEKKDKREYEKDTFVNQLDGHLDTAQVQPVSASGPGDDSARVEHPADDLEGTEPGTQAGTAQPDVIGDKNKDASVADGAGPTKASVAGKKNAGGRKSSAPVGEKKRTPLIAAIAVVVLLVGAGAFWYLKAISGGSVAEDYAALVARLESTADDAQKERLINIFIDSYTDDPVYTDKAMQALFNVLGQMEASDYEKASQAVFNLPLDRQYYQKAKKIFNSFLARHPESRFRDDISKRLAEISELTDDAHFSELSDLDQRDYLGRLEAYHVYLRTYPDGRHREEVEQLAMYTLKTSYREFSTKIEKYKQRKKWDDCIALCRQYRETFQRYMNMAAVDKIEALVLELQALDVLKAETEDADDETVLKHYLAFIKSYPNSSERNRLEQRVAEIEKKFSDRDEWMRAKSVGQDTTKALSYRIALLRRYIDQNPIWPYMIEAENLLWKLEQQAKTGTTTGSSTQAGSSRTKTAPATTADNGKTALVGQDKAAHLENLQQRVSDDLVKTKGRYVVTTDGTVRDNKTSLAWTTLDSFQVMGRCVDYRQAVSYVKQLKDGGHGDWRMPTSAELTGIYQNSPYFPASGAAWYWSSEVYEKGYQTIANIVYAEPEAVYRKRTAEVRKCGSVRAVRP